MKKAVILLSGGLDSVTCLAIAKSEGFECYTISFDYGQKHTSELEQAKVLSKEFSAKRHEIVKLSIGNLGGSALTDSNIEIPDFKGDNSIPLTYVPARNTTFLSIALGYAEILDASSVFIGVSSIDYSGYPDCRPEYIEAFQKMANLATKKGVEGSSIKIETPLIALSKAETIMKGLELGVDYSKTISCYRANEQGRACGACDSCILRKEGFEKADIKDPTHYIF